MTDARTCVGNCGRTISRQSKKGLCRSCAAKRLNSDPAIVAKRQANIQRYYDTPGVREEHARRLARHMANMPAEEIERRREHGRRTARAVLARPDVRAKSNGREAKRIAGIRRSATVLAWCPPEWRDRYRELCKRGRRAGVARRMVMTEIEAERLKSLDPNLAADFIRKTAAISRCDAGGGFAIAGSHWRYGSKILTRIEVVELAVRKGWDPDGWRRIGRPAASTAHHAHHP